MVTKACCPCPWINLIARPLLMSAIYQHVYLNLIIAVATRAMPKSFSIAMMSHGITPMACHPRAYPVLASIMCLRPPCCCNTMPTSKTLLGAAMYHGLPFPCTGHYALVQATHLKHPRCCSSTMPCPGPSLVAMTCHGIAPMAL